MLVNTNPGPAYPSRVELLECLRVALVKVEKRLLKEFPKHIAQEATDKAEITANDAIWDGLAQRMTSPARRKWLWVVARNEAVTILRRKRMVSLPDDDLIPAPSSTWIDLHERGLVHEALRQLRPDFQEVIEVVYFEGLSNRAAARSFGIPEATFRRRRYQAISLLRGIVKRLSCEF